MDLRLSPELYQYTRTQGLIKPSVKTDSSVAKQADFSVDQGVLADTQDIIQLPAIKPAAAPKTHSALLSQETEETEYGFRKTSTYQQGDGRNFTRTEETVVKDSGARRTVVQQNPSGSITLYEEVLDRQENGTFRRTQRFRDETGAVETQIQLDYTVTDPFVLSGGSSDYRNATVSPFQSFRGTQLDLNA